MDSCWCMAKSIQYCKVKQSKIKKKKVKNIKIKLETIIQAESDIQIPKSLGFWCRELYLTKRNHIAQSSFNCLLWIFPAPLLPISSRWNVSQRSFLTLTSFPAQTCWNTYFTMITVPLPPRPISTDHCPTSTDLSLLWVPGSSPENDLTQVPHFMEGNTKTHRVTDLHQLS